MWEARFYCCYHDHYGLSCPVIFIPTLWSGGWEIVRTWKSIGRSQGQCLAQSRSLVSVSYEDENEDDDNDKAENSVSKKQFVFWLLWRKIA